MERRVICLIVDNITELSKGHEEELKLINGGVRRIFSSLFHYRYRLTKSKAK